MGFQHVGQSFEKLPCGGIQISNPKKIKNLLTDNEMINCSTKSTPSVAIADLSAQIPEEDK